MDISIGKFYFCLTAANICTLQKVLIMKTFLFFLYLLPISLLAQSQNLIPINQGSKVHFVIKNFGIATGGDFSSLSGEIKFDPAAPTNAKFDISVKASTIDTDNSLRDESLVESTYFDAKKYPEIRLVSTKIGTTNKSAEGYYYFYGNLIIKNISKPISFPFKVEKNGSDYTFSGDFIINRLDFNVGEKSMVLSNKVSVQLSILAKSK